MPPPPVPTVTVSDVIEVTFIHLAAYPPAPPDSPWPLPPPPDPTNSTYIFLIPGGLFQGVMSDEIPQEAVIKHFDGYDRVNYNMLDVEFKQI